MKEIKQAYEAIEIPAGLENRLEEKLEASLGTPLREKRIILKPRAQVWKPLLTAAAVLLLLVVTAGILRSLPTSREETGQIIPAASPVQTEAASYDTAEYLQAYLPILDAYRDALVSRDREACKEQGLCSLFLPVYSYQPCTAIGYALQDLDDDGSLELLIGPMPVDQDREDDTAETLYDAYYLREGKPVQIFCADGAEKWRCLGDGKFLQSIYEQYAHSCYVLWQYHPSEKEEAEALHFLDGLTKDTDSEKQNETWYVVEDAWKTLKDEIPAKAIRQGSEIGAEDAQSWLDAHSDFFTPDYISIEGRPSPTPQPDPSCFGTVEARDAEAMLVIIDRARALELLGEDETVAFDPEALFDESAEIEYYLDNTILVICWKEKIEGNTCSFAEVKLADPEQLRRYDGAAEGEEPTWSTCTELHRSTNAVLSLNGDMAGLHELGIVVSDGVLSRFSTEPYTGSYRNYNCLETCLVDEQGDFHFTELGKEYSKEELQQYLKENKIRFSLSFGPVLVRDGEVQQCDWYPLGEIDRGYSRAGIGQVDRLHYLYMSVNHSPEAEARWTVNQFARHFGEKPVQNAYCLDGGQTAEIVFRDRPYNTIDYGTERPVIDDLYFVTARSGDWEG